jgi:hypothetical protein
VLGHPDAVAADEHRAVVEQALGLLARDAQVDGEEVEQRLVAVAGDLPAEQPAEDATPGSDNEQDDTEDTDGPIA